MQRQIMDIVGPELAPGEQVRWTGMSSSRAVLLGSLRPMAFGLVFAGLPVLSKAAWPSDPLQMLFGAAFLAVFAVVGLSVFGRALFDVLGARTTAYAITDKRILVVRELFGRRVSSIAPSRINTVEHRQQADGSGSVVFRVDDAHGIEASGIQKSSFYGIRDVAGAVRALEQLRTTTV